MEMFLRLTFLPLTILLRIFAVPLNVVKNLIISYVYLVALIAIVTLAMGIARDPQFTDDIHVAEKMVYIGLISFERSCMYVINMEGGAEFCGESADLMRKAVSTASFFLGYVPGLVKIVGVPPYHEMSLKSVCSMAHDNAIGTLRYAVNFYDSLFRSILFEPK